MNTGKERAITLFRKAPRSREFDETATNAGLTHEEKSRCR
jgi:hypothetical protein